MPRTKKYAAVLVEPGYDKLIYSDYCLRGIRDMAARKDVQLRILSPFDPSEGYPDRLPVCVILMCATELWADSVSAELHKRGCEVIQMPCTYGCTDPRNHTIGENIDGYCEEIYRYVIAGGRRKIALLGFKNGALDKERVRALFHAKETMGGVGELTLLPPDQDFASIPGSFDTVIVNNGTNAAVFVMWANENGVRIPSELWVLTTQATRITGIISPSITTVSALDYFVMGESAVQLMLMLSSLQMQGQIHLKQNYELIPRDSTAGFAPGQSLERTPSYRLTPQRWMRKNDFATCLCYEIENKLFCLNDTDLDILRQVLLRTTTEQIAELANMSISAVNYHIKSILELFHADSRQALVKLFAENNLLGMDCTE
ncbi:MAG: substrate-binding domain-containing protein [Clostridia bacterium]|nr:substrate-binding domain-containing protein [Clostridia bacterium]